LLHRSRLHHQHRPGLLTARRIHFLKGHRLLSAALLTTTHLTYLLLGFLNRLLCLLTRAARSSCLLL
jgi:hypothetical protein